MSSRWDRDRFDYEQDRARYNDDRSQMRGSTSGRGRDDYDDRRQPRAYDDDLVRERRYYEDEPRYPRREFAPEYERRAPPVMERERERDYYRRDSPQRRPNFLRRQSSLDTFDRRPARNLYEPREEYPPPARREDIYREDYRAPAYTDIPLPKTKTKALPPPRRYEDRYYEDIKVAEPDHYGDDDYRTMPDRVREREYIRSRDRRDERGSPAPSRSTRHRSRRGSSPTSMTTSRSSSSSGGTTIKSEYPKKGKTRIPARLVSKRALIDLGFPFTEEGTTIIVLKALGQENIDELLKVSEEYKKSELEIAAARSSAGNIEDQREEIFVPPASAVPPPTAAPPTVAPPPPAPAPAPAPAPTYVPPQAPTYVPPQAPTYVPPPAPAPAPVTEAPPAQAPVIINAGPSRDYSPSRTSTTTTSYDDSSYYHHHHHHHHDHEASAPVPVGPLALAERSRSRSRSRGGREIRSEIKALERELAHRPKRDVGPVSGRELVRAERLPNGELVVYEEQVEKVEHVSKPGRIEKDKKGRLTLSLPRR